MIRPIAASSLGACSSPVCQIAVPVHLGAGRRPAPAPQRPGPRTQPAPRTRHRGTTRRSVGRSGAPGHARKLRAWHRHRHVAFLGDPRRYAAALIGQGSHPPGSHVTDHPLSLEDDAGPARFAPSGGVNDERSGVRTAGFSRLNHKRGSGSGLGRAKKTPQQGRRLVSYPSPTVHFKLPATWPTHHGNNQPLNSQRSEEFRPFRVAADIGGRVLRTRDARVQRSAIRSDHLAGPLPCALLSAPLGRRTVSDGFVARLSQARRMRPEERRRVPPGHMDSCRSMESPPGHGWTHFWKRSALGIGEARSRTCGTMIVGISPRQAATRSSQALRRLRPLLAQDADSPAAQDLGSTPSAATLNPLFLEQTGPAPSGLSRPQPSPSGSRH